MKILKTLSVLLTVVMALSSCSKAADTSESIAQTTANSTETTENSAQTTTATAAEYNYTQELNVIDDKYRTFYEVFVYSYADSDGDGIGDLNGLAAKLDYIQEMGFNGIWLMPINPSTTYHKYDVIDYMDIDKEYGTLEDFQNLLNECHKRDIRLIMDFVVNHTSTRHEWFKQAVSALENGEDSPYIDYYNFSQNKSEIDQPYKAGNSDWYYEGKFWSEMPDLNLENESLRADLEEIMAFWLDMGVDGFRIDAAKEFYSGNPEKNIEVLKWLSDFVHGYKEDSYVVAEVWEGFTAMSKYYESGVDSLFNFAFSQETGVIAKTLGFSKSKNAAREFGAAMETVDTKLSSISENAIDAPFFTNHDTARASGFFNRDSDKIKMAGALNLFMSGNVFVYYGEEIGMSGSGRDENKRAPYVWSSSGSDFDTVGPADMETVTHSFDGAAEQLDDELSILNFYKQVIRIRNENPEIARGTVENLEIGDAASICAVKKTYGESEIFLVYNISDEEATVNPAGTELAGKAIRGYVSAQGGEVTLVSDELVLPPYSVVVLK